MGNPGGVFQLSLLAISPAQGDWKEGSHIHL